MRVSCGTCGRDFEVDDGRASNLNAARCICGMRISLQDEGSEEDGPRRLGKYLLLRKIATGGMGEIFYGKIAGVEGFEREVAIKKMLPHLSADADFIRMMIKEAKLTVLLNHPNIVQVYDLAKEKDEYYIAMEYVPGINGGTLLEKARGGKIALPMEMASFVTSQVLRGLDYAHELKGADGSPMHILHRDITPQNILITRDAWVKITDFGIAKARNEISTTSPGMIKGKLGYIAPEQLAGKEVDQRVDIFCAGILLWESLAVRRLFKGQSEIDTFRLIAEAKVPSIRKLRNDVPEALEQVIMKSLARDPDDRYHSASEFYEGINQALLPKTMDDCANVTKAFLAKHDDFFAEVGGEENNGEVMAEPTVELAPDEGTLTDIAELLAEKHDPVTSDNVAAVLQPGPRGRSGVGIFVGMLLIGIIAAGAWRFKDQLFGGVAPPVNKPPPRAGSGGLSPEEIQLAVDGEKVRILDCYRKALKKVSAAQPLTANLVIPSTGGVASLEFSTKVAAMGRAGPCLESVMRNLKFRTHSLPKVEAKVSLPEVDEEEAPLVTGSSRPKSYASNKPLTGSEIQSTVRKYSGGITKCLLKVDRANAPPKVDARILIDPTGRVSSVVFTPQLTQTGVQQCLARSLKSMRFRKHPTKDFQVTIPLKIQVL